MVGESGADARLDDRLHLGVHLREQVARVRLGLHDVRAELLQHDGRAQLRRVRGHFRHIWRIAGRSLGHTGSTASGPIGSGLDPSARGWGTRGASRAPRRARVRVPARAAGKEPRVRGRKCNGSAAVLAEKTVSLKKARPLLPHQMAARRPRARRHARWRSSCSSRFRLARRVPARRQLQRFVTSAVGDTETAPRRSMVGFAQDCNGLPRQKGTLCGARGAYLRGHYLWVAATQVDAVTVVDVSARHAHGRGQRLRPHAPQGGRRGVGARLGRVRSGHRYAQRPIASATSRSWTSARTACGEKTHSGGTAQPRVVAATRDCESRDGRSVGRLCGARARGWRTSTSPPR